MKNGLLFSEYDPGKQPDRKSESVSDAGFSALGESDAARPEVDKKRHGKAENAVAFITSRPANSLAKYLSCASPILIYTDRTAPIAQPPRSKSRRCLATQPFRQGHG